MREEGREIQEQKKEWEGTRKQAGIHGVSKGDGKAGRAGRRETGLCR